MSGGGGSSVVGFRYFFDIHMGLGRGPVDELVAVQVADRLVWQGSMNGTGDTVIDRPNAFGGDAKEGGIKGTMTVMMGEPDQVPNAGVQGLQPPGVLVGFRRMLTVFYSGLVCSGNPYPKKWSFRVRRSTKGWDGEVFRPDLATITFDGNALGYDADDVFNHYDLPDIALSGPGNACAWSPAGAAYLLAGGQGGGVDLPGTYLQLFKRNGQTFEQLYTIDGGPSATVNCIAWSPDGTYAVVGSYDFPYARIYKRENDNLRHLTSASLTLYGPATSAAWSPDGKFLAVANLASAPYLTIWRQDGDDFSLFSPAPMDTTGDSAGLAWSHDGQFLAVAHSMPPYLTVYRRGATSFDKLPTPTPSLPGPGMSCAWSPDGMLLSVGHNGGDFLTHFTWNGTTFNAVPFTGTPPPNAVNGISWRPDGKFMTIAHYDGNHVTTYQYNGGTFTDGPVLTRLPTNGAFGVDWDDEGKFLAVASFGYPYLQIYGRGSAEADLEPDRKICAMNPAHIIFECLTNREWGRGLDRSVINIPSFEAAATTLKAESFGLCLKWSRKDSIESFVQSVLDHIGATLYSDRETALLTLMLIRGGYDRNTLPLYDTSNGILEFRESTTSTTSGAVNEVIVTYRDPVLNESKPVRVQNLANLQSSAGAFRTMSKSYPGLPTADLALRVAQRDLRANAEGLRRFTLTMDRRAWKIAPGSVIRIQDPTRNIPDMAVRVARIEDGTLTSGRMTVTVVQDVFTLPKTTFVQEQPNTWIPPDFLPCIGRHEVFEAPYFLLNRTMTQAEFQYVDDSSAYIGIVAEKGQPMNADYKIAVRDGGSTAEDVPTNTQAYCGYVPPTP